MNDIFKALNDPIRREILDLLKSRDMSAGEIADHFQVSKPTISHHLDLLRQADLVTSEKQGQYVFYSINTSVLDELFKWVCGMNMIDEKKAKIILNSKNK